MSGLSDYSAENVLNYQTGKTAMPTLPTVYIALFTTAPTSDAGTGGTEVSGGSYARVATTGSTWNAASASSGSEPSTTPAFTSNATAITFATATASWGTVTSFGAYDALTAGNLLWWDYLGNFKWIPFTCTSASPGVLTVDAAGDVPTNGSSCVVTTKYGGTLPTTGGSWAGLLTSAGSSGNTFNLGVNTTSTGNGLFRQVTQQSIPSGVQASFAGGTPGQLVVSLA